MRISRGVGDSPESFALVEVPGDEPTVGPVRSRRPQGGRLNLPEPISSFIGRQDEVEAVADMVAHSRLVTVAGTGGIGKTRLALEAARARIGPVSDGERLGGVAPLRHLEAIWIVELAPVNNPELVPHAILSALLGPDPCNASPAHDLVDFLRERRTLLILDNCEHVLDGCVALTTRLLRSCPRLRILTTSREPLRITGERVWWLQPLAVPGPDETASAALAGNESVELFVERTRDAVPDFDLTAEVGPAVAEICRRLDGLPLAIELAAARTAVLTPAEILDRLDDRFHLLTGGSASADARHRTLRATLEWSHDLLSPAERMLFRRLSVFAGGWSLEAAEQVCGADGVALADVLDLLTALRAKSLVVAEQSGGTTRYRMLETIRDFARSVLEVAGEAPTLQRRHAAWCVARAEEAERGREGSGHEAWLLRLDEDHDNFRVALAWARDNDEAEVGLRLANALTWFWQTRGNLREGLGWLEWALSAAGQEPSAARARTMRSVGRIIHTLGDHTSGLALINRSVALFREVGEVKEAGGCVCQDLFQMCRNPLHAIPMMEQNVARMRTMEDPNRLAHALANLGLARFFRGDATGARSCFVEVLALRVAGIDGDATEQALMGLARVALLGGQYDEVEAPLLEVFDHAQRVGDPDGESAALSLLGELARARGDSAKARALLADALDYAREGGAALSIGRCELFLAGVELADGELDAARSLFTKAMRRVEAGATLAYHQVRCSLGLADVAAATGKPAVAASFYAEAHDAAQANGDEQGVARALAGRADLALAASDFDAASRLRHEALELDAHIGDRPAIVRSLEALATLATAEGRLDKAARLFGAASALREGIGMARPARFEAGYGMELERTRAGMAPGDWQDAWEQGRRLSMNEALSYARKGRGRRGRPTAGWDSLTPAERDVVALVVEGLTNPEVGERLFISRRTVGHHLAHVYAKLGIRSRRELTREALGWDGARSPV